MNAFSAARFETTPVYKSNQNNDRLNIVERSREVNKPPLSKQIESNWYSQPQSVKNIYLETGGDFSKIFVKAEKIDGKDFIFSSVYQDPESGYNTVMAFTKDKYSQNKYLTRVFYKSQSDNQWRSIPELRLNGDFMKGGEDNPLNHYVQSSKLGKKIHHTLDNLPVARNKYGFNPLSYLPQGYNEYRDENNFTERYKSLKNPEWAQYQKFCQHCYSIYYHCVASTCIEKDYTYDGDFYRWLEGKEKNDNLKTLKQVIEELSEYSGTYIKLKRTTIYDLKNDRDPNIRRLVQTYDKEVSALVEDLFKLKVPESIIPNFSEENCIDKYTKKNNKGSNIQIEEYKVTSSEGDELVFAMAYDKKGNVYIDNIYDPRDHITTYGTMSEIVQMGYLIYKPEDYKSQADIGFPKEFLGEDNGKYVNINKLWRKIPIIDRFSSELEKRKRSRWGGFGRFRGRYS
jgi:hypothetical protein